MDTKQEQKKQVKKCQCNDEYKNKYLRALADYQNLENRIVTGQDDIRKNANKNLIIKLLSFLDSLDKAEIFIKDKNLNLITENFRKILKSEGLEEIEVLNKEYDPYTAEVIDMVDGKKNNIVVEVLRKGYKLNGSIIRAAQVKVEKKL